MIFTHVKPDLDALASVWAHMKFVAKSTGNLMQLVTFVPAAWSGSDMKEGDVALDIEADGKGLKGTFSQKKVGSCFSLVLLNCELSVQKALEPLRQYIEAQDSTGDGLYEVMSDFFVKIEGPPYTRRFTRKDVPLAIRVTGMLSFLRALQEAKCDDHTTLRTFILWFEGIYTTSCEIRDAAAKAVDCYRSKSGHVALNPHGFGVSAALFDKGAKLVVWTSGMNLGITRSKDWETIDLSKLAPPVIKALAPAEEGWFFHKSGFTAMRGGEKSPVMTPSVIDPVALVDALDEALKAEKSAAFQLLQGGQS